MSASATVTPTSWRGFHHGQGHLGHSAYDPALSFAYTSVSGRGPSTILTSGASLGAASLGGASDGMLTRELVQDGLTDLGRTGDGTKMSYLTLTLPACSLMDISLLSSYPYIQRLDLSSNNLTDLSSLGSLPYLIYLDVSHNKLTTILDFQPPPYNLLEMDYSHNEIEEICDLSPHHSLSKVILDCNQITQISGLSSLRRLAHLSLADNRIEAISNLDHLPIKFLRLSGNGIMAIDNLGTLARLQVIDLSGNTISSLRGLEDHQYLQEINMEDNKIMDVKEIVFLTGLQMLKTLNLSSNPVETLIDYRPLVIFHLPSVFLLDCRRVDPKEKVAAINRFSPPLEVVAAHDHRTNVAGAVHKPSRIRFSTLTRVEEPYPMLVLCGPPGSGKRAFCKHLVDDFPRFFGLGVSHTTRPQRPKESHGRDYLYIDSGTFSRAVKTGEFVQTVETACGGYGLSITMVEQVAQMGLACVTHMGLEGVLSMKNTHFEPRYILTLPLTPQIHEQRLREKDCYSEEEIRAAMEDVQKYKDFHLERPGFFDTAINTDHLKSGYFHLRALVMAYGDITPDTPLSPLSSSSQQSSSILTSEQSSTHPHTTTQTPSLLDPFEVDTGTTPSGKPAPYHAINPETIKHIHDVAKNWSNQHPSARASQSHSMSGSRPASRQDTPTLDLSGRRHMLIRAAVAGKATPDSYLSGSKPGTRPGTGGSKSEHHRHSKTVSASLADYSEESEEEEEGEHSQSSLSKLSSERDFTPTEEEPLSPTLSQD